jgi:hypothetical protein
MAEKDFCSGCPQSRDCKAVYKQIGNSKGPGVVRIAITAFLLPIAVFIAALAVSDHALKQAIAGKNLRIMVGFALAAAVSFVCILIVRAVNVRLAKRWTLRAYNETTCHPDRSDPKDREVEGSI